MTSKTSTIVLNEGSATPTAVTVKELTVKEVKNWLDELQKGLHVSYIDALLLKGAMLHDLTLFSSLTLEQIDELCPSDLDQVLEEAKKLNPLFFDFRDRVVRVGQIPEKNIPLES